MIDGENVADFLVNEPGTLTITRYDEYGITGSFVSNPPFELTGSFDVSFVEQWEP